MIQLVSNAATPAPAAAGADQAKLKSAAQAFEAVFIRQLVSSMRDAKLGDGMLDSDASDQFQEMADARTADAMAKQGVFGIADMLVKQLAPIAAKAEAAAGTAHAQASTDAATDAAATLTAKGPTT